jgi:hypothetical protein
MAYIENTPIMNNPGMQMLYSHRNTALPGALLRVASRAEYEVLKYRRYRTSPVNGHFVAQTSRTDNKSYFTFDFGTRKVVIIDRSTPVSQDYRGMAIFGINILVSPAEELGLAVAGNSEHLTFAVCNNAAGRVGGSYTGSPGLPDRSRWCLQYELKDDEPIQSVASISLNAAQLRNILNKVAKDNTLGISLIDGEVSVYGDEVGRMDPVSHYGATTNSTDTDIDDTFAAIPFRLLYDDLFRRKSNVEGIRQIPNVEVHSVGITTDGEFYLRVSDESGLEAYMIYANDPIETEVYESRFEQISDTEIDVKTRKRRSSTKTQPVVVIQSSETPSDLTEAEQARLLIWQAAHKNYCATHNVSESTSTTVWFSHYTMHLIQNGESPSEEDFALAAKV